MLSKVSRWTGHCMASRVTKQGGATPKNGGSRLTGAISSFILGWTMIIRSECAGSVLELTAGSFFSR